MSFRPSLFIVVIACSIFVSGPFASAQTNSQRDAVIGGVAGAIIGGIAGNQNDETPEGIAIGGVAGAIAGHVIGKSKDRNLEEQYHYQQQAAQVAQEQQYQQAVQFQKAISIQDAIALSNSGVSQQLIINQIHSNGVQQEIGVSEILALHQNGVSELVINEMQRASVGAPVSQTVITPVSPTVIAQPPAVLVKPSPVIVARPPIRSPAIIVQTGKPSKVYSNPRSHYRPPSRSAYGYGRGYKHGGKVYR